MSRFDDSWPAADAALSVEMGEEITIGGMKIADAVVDVPERGAKLSGMAVASGVHFMVYLSASQIYQLSPVKGATALQTKEVTRGTFKGRVVAVSDLGGGGAMLDVGPLSGR